MSVEATYIPHIPSAVSERSVSGIGDADEVWPIPGFETDSPGKVRRY